MRTKRPHSICEGCMYDRPEYKAALEIAKQNNPSLFARQDEHNQTKRAYERRVKFIETGLRLLLISGFLGTIVVLSCRLYCLCAGINEFIPHTVATGAFMFLPFAMVVSVVGLFETMEHYQRFWLNASSVDYELYKQMKIELKAAGFDMDAED